MYTGLIWSNIDKKLGGCHPLINLKKRVAFLTVIPYLSIVSEICQKKQLRLRSILMDLIKIMEMFPDQAACIAYLEQLRWQGSPECPHCESTHVNKRNETTIGRIGRWNCHDCHSTFKVTSGTLFTKTKIALQKWFLAIALMANAKKSLSSYQLARDIGVPQKTAWRVMMCIRAEMGKDNVLGQGPVEADETYIGGSSRKDYDKEEGEPRPRGVALLKMLLLVLLSVVGKS